MLTDSGVRLGVVVSDLHGQSARAMVKAIIAGQSPQEVLKLASRRLKASREEIFDALQGDLTASHRFVLDELMRHIEEIEARIARFDTRLLAELESERDALALLQSKRLSIGVIAGWSAMRYRSAGGFRRSAASTGAV